MRTLLKILLLILIVVAVNMVLLNVFHAKEYISVGISLAIALLAAGYEGSRKK